MRLFDRRPAVSVEEFCQNFYDAHVFFSISDSKYLPAPAGIQGMHKIFWDTVVSDLLTSDSAYNQVDENLFYDEVIALRLEIFALSWQHLFRNRNDIMLAQSIFTKNYLISIGREDIWELMNEYNGLVSKSGNFQTAQALGYFPSKNPAIMERVLQQNNVAKMNAFDNMYREGIDGFCVSRVANRAGTFPEWQKGIGIAILGPGFTDRLGIVTDADGDRHLGSMIRMIYEGTQTMTEKVKIVTSI